MAVSDFMEAAEVAKKLEISVTAVHRLEQRGTLPSVWLAGRKIWHRDTISRYLGDGDAQARRRGSSSMSVRGRLSIDAQRPAGEK